MKANFTVSLDKEETKKLQKVLSKGGMTLSGYLNTCIHEYLEALESMRVPMNPADMNVTEFLKQFAKFLSGMQGRRSKAA
jgi:hypothetical protein